MDCQLFLLFSSYLLYSRESSRPPCHSFSLTCWSTFLYGFPALLTTISAQCPALFATLAYFLMTPNEILENYKKSGGNWESYRSEFLELIAQRRIEKQFSRDLLDCACLLCSEASSS